MKTDKNLLRVEGGSLVDADGKALALRGTSLGGWLNMENFIGGFSGNEEALRRALRDVLGPALSDMFFGKFLDCFFTQADADHIASLGMNNLRIPLNYRHFEDDSNPMEIKESGFEHLDRAVEICAARGIYVILDLHALPGFQNQDWHSDNPTHEAFFWQHRHFQDRVVNLWKALAAHYRDNAWVAGYNLINEPAVPDPAILRGYYERLIDAVRSVDPGHVIFLDANRYACDTDAFDESWPNVVFAIHDYPAPGQVSAGPYPGISSGRHFDTAVIEKDFCTRAGFMLERGLPIWVGEFGPVYTGDSQGDRMRYSLLRDQIAAYEKHGAMWSVWTYKDVGVMGIVCVSPESPYLQRVRPLLDKQERLGACNWKTLDTNIRQIMGPLEELFEKEFPGYEPFPFGAGWKMRRLIRGILLSEPLLDEWASLFTGLDEDDIEKLAASFEFENCIVRTQLEEILRDACVRQRG